MSIYDNALHLLIDTDELSNEAFRLKRTARIHNVAREITSLLPFLWVIYRWKANHFGLNDPSEDEDLKLYQLSPFAHEHEPYTVKYGRSVFEAQGFEEWLIRNKIKSLFFSGYDHDACVHDSIMDTLRKGFNAYVFDDLSELSRPGSLRNFFSANNLRLTARDYGVNFRIISSSHPRLKMRTHKVSSRVEHFPYAIEHPVEKLPKGFDACLG